MKAGDKILLLKSHPHAGEVGYCVGHFHTLLGPLPVVRLSACKHGVNEVFVPREKDYKVIK